MSVDVAQALSDARGVRRTRYEKNLLILHTPRLQDISDWLTVRDKISTRAPEIEVRIGSNVKADPETREWQTTRPSLVFSPVFLHAYKPAGGAVYAGRRLSKIAETRRMAETGLPVPRTAFLAPGRALTPDEWGEYVIVKPAAIGLMGRGVRLVRTDEVERRFAELTDNGRLPMLVQPYIDHVDAENRLYSYRVLTMFGEPLYASERNCRDPRRPLAEIAVDPDGKIASNAQGSANTGQLTWQADVLALARRAALSFPRIPVLAQDIVRQTGSGKLYILEVNSWGYSWHLSSDFSRSHNDDAFMQAKYDQFGALDIVAEKLIEKTRAEAA